MSEYIKELITLAQLGDEKSREDLWEAFRPLRYKWAASISLPGWEWDDLQQEAFVILIQAIDKYDAALGMTFEGYYKVSLYNWRYNKFRKKKEYLGIGEDIAEQGAYQIPEYTEDLGDIICTQIGCQRIVELLGELKELDRELIIRHYFQYQPIKEAGEALGLKDKAAYSRMHRIIKNLRKKF